MSGVDLMQWLTAQLDEDERLARAAGGRSEQTWQADTSGVDPIGGKSWPLVVRYVTGDQLRGAVTHLPVMQERSEDRMRHIAAHDPARVLREIDAKRQLVQKAADADRYSRTTWANAGSVGAASAYRAMLRLLALPYEDRPGYREDWRP